MIGVENMLVKGKSPGQQTTNCLVTMYVSGLVRTATFRTAMWGLLGLIEEPTPLMTRPPGCTFHLRLRLQAASTCLREALFDVGSTP